MAKSKATELKPYTALRRVSHDGETYQAGEPIELTADDAEDLKKIDAVKEFVPPPAAAADKAADKK